MASFMPSAGSDASSVVMSIEEKYTFGGVLGEGGYGVVKSGQRVTDQHEVAIKILDRKKMSLKPNAESSLRREVFVLQQLNHTNIVHLEEFLETPTNFYLVMEIIGGGELFDRIVVKKTYHEHEAKELCVILLNALKYMHDKNLIHRDIKPENLMLASRDNDINVKLVDFGFATEVDGFNLNYYCGTLSYMAPEIISNMSYGTYTLLFLCFQIDWSNQVFLCFPGKPVDMWSFGVVLYILLGGYPPFYDKSQMMLSRKITKAAYCFHEGYWDAVSEEGKDLIQKLLVVDYAKRLTVDQALAHPWIAPPVPPMKRELSRTLSELRKFQARRKLRVGIRAVLAADRFLYIHKVKSIKKLSSIPEENEPTGSGGQSVKMEVSKEMQSIPDSVFTNTMFLVLENPDTVAKPIEPSFEMEL